jgi:sugar lactone lactonase YvrE
MPKSNIGSRGVVSDRTPMNSQRWHGWALAAVSVLIAVLAGASIAHAASYGVEGTFDHGTENIGVAVDQATGDVYAADFTSMDKFNFAGERLAPAPFVEDNGADEAVAIDPLNHNVYVYNAIALEIETFDSSGVKLGSFPIPSPGGLIGIASDSSGNVYIPEKSANTVLKFSPAGTLEATFQGEAPVGAFAAPQGVAVDGAGDVFVADTGNGRVVRIEAGTGVQSVVDDAGAQDVAVDPVSGDVFALDLSSEGSCEALSAPCYRVRAYHSGEVAPFDEFGAGTIHNEGLPNRIAVDHETGRVYVSDFEHGIWIFALGTPPTVTYPATSATAVTGSGATLHGEVNPEGNPTSCSFEYGTSGAYGASVPCQPAQAGAGSQAVPESVAISGLEGNTEYHFRLVAVTASGALIGGADQTFTTGLAPPAVAAAAASNVTQSDVVFNARVNPQHLDTHYYVFYGRYLLEDSGSCEPAGTVPYASVPTVPIDIEGAYSSAEEVAGIPVGLDLAGASAVLHSGMESSALEPNTAYHFQVVAENAAGTSCGPETTFLTLPPAPLAATGAASAVTQTTANLAGAVTPGSTGPNSDTTWSFEYGTSIAYGVSAPLKRGDAGVGTSALALSATLDGLAPNTTYHYRLVASNANEDPAGDPALTPQVGQGVDKTFTTPALEPLVGQVSGLSETGVTLNGEVNPSGQPLEYRFQYGTSASYGQSTPLASAGAGDAYAPVGATLAGLAPGVYHYRLVAVGAGSESFSADSTFTLYGSVPAVAAANPFAVGQGTPLVLGTTALLSIPSFPSLPAMSTTGGKPRRKLTCQAKAKRIKSPAKRRQALKRCMRAKGKGRRV